MKLRIFIVTVVLILIGTGCTICTKKPNHLDNTNKSEIDVNITIANNLTERLLDERYDDPVALEVVLGYKDAINPDTPDEVTPETATLIKLLKRDLNIEIKYKWIVNSDQYDAKFAAELAVGNLPDIVKVTPTQFQSLYKQGRLADLTKIYEKYANDTIKDITNADGKIIKAGMRDDKIYGLPNSQFPGQYLGQTYYRMDLLRMVGYDKPPSTIEDFELLCDKLMTIDWDNDGIIGEPVIAAGKNYDFQLAGLVPFFMAYSVTTDGWYENEQGMLEYGGINPGLMKPLAKLREWYKKGYLEKDFAAQDAFAIINNSVVEGIIDGQYPIVCGSWWIPNWPLNYSVNKNPAAEWVIGPTLSVDGQLPDIFVPRYPIPTFTVVSKDCKNPEAIFKIMNYTANYESNIDNPINKKNMTEEERREYNSYVQNWLPWEVYIPTSIVNNYDVINTVLDKGFKEMPDKYIQKNTEFWKAWNAYQQYNKNPLDGSSWGMYFSRVAKDGGVANMKDLYDNANIIYDEVYIATDTMVKKEEELKQYQDTIYLSMIMGDMPIDYFYQYIEEWKSKGGEDIGNELSIWYRNKK